ncbi:MAG: hypothetical protein IBX72_12510 [Nitrospirae bacterium]|nr:hypothetical protein [Nitrospirota bacterium]
MEEVDLEKELCLRFCSYYKPPKDNILACMGYTVIKKLLQKGNRIPFRKTERKISFDTEKLLIENMCIVCPFYKEDCDFIQRKEESLPCGGFILLCHLLEENFITIDNIKDIR